MSLTAQRINQSFVVFDFKIAQRETAFDITLVDHSVRPEQGIRKFNPCKSVNLLLATRRINTEGTKSGVSQCKAYNMTRSASGLKVNLENQKLYMSSFISQAEENSSSLFVVNVCFHSFAAWCRKGQHVGLLWKYTHVVEEVSLLRRQVAFAARRFESYCFRCLFHIMT